MKLILELKKYFTLIILLTISFLLFSNVSFALSDNNKKELYNKDYKLSNSNASKEAKELFDFLKDSYGKYILSGQQVYSDFNCEDFQQIKEKTGKLPAILGLDLLGITPSIQEIIKLSYGWMPEKNYDKVIETAEEYVNNGGIVSFCWHWNLDFNFMKDTNNFTWMWQSYRTKYVNIDLEKVLENENSKEYKLLEKDMDAIAVELKKLSDKNIPILFRPLHEAGGEWFWWSSGGEEAYIKLWRKMYDKFTNEYKLNNLIWVWNGIEAKYYPGDEYVDISGLDWYADKKDYDPQSNRFEEYLSFTKSNKILAYTELGTLFDIDEAFNNNTIWSWFLNWSSPHTIPEESTNENDIYTSLEMWNKVFKHEKVLTLDELPFHSHIDDDKDEICDFCNATINSNKKEEISSLKYTIENDYISRISPNTTVEQFKQNMTFENFTTIPEMIFLDNNNNVLKENSFIQTGTKLKIDNKLQFTLIVTGDIDGNSKISINDLSQIKLHIIEKKKLTGINLIAADIDGNSKITINDLAQIKLILVGVK